ncbi:hypothetical protein AD428_04190 [Achromobacter sp. DMS1]|nr:hypothetical protein AD428_04190 [Achromobacter sp. DMS1]
MRIGTGRPAVQDALQQPELIALRLERALLFHQGEFVLVVGAENRGMVARPLGQAHARLRPRRQGVPARRRFGRGGRPVRLRRAAPALPPPGWQHRRRQQAEHEPTGLRPLA